MFKNIKISIVETLAATILLLAGHLIHTWVYNNVNATQSTTALPATDLEFKKISPPVNINGKCLRLKNNFTPLVYRPRSSSSLDLKLERYLKVQYTTATSGDQCSNINYPVNTSVNVRF